MKKLPYPLFLFCALFVNACETNNVRKTGEGVKMSGKSCNEVAGNSRKASNALKKENKAKERDHNVSAILPAYSWDTKSMIW